MTTSSLEKPLVPSAGELILYMQKDLAALAVLAYFGTNKHRETTLAALYECEYLRSKQKVLESLETEPAMKNKLIESLKKEGFLGL